MHPGCLCLSKANIISKLTISRTGPGRVQFVAMAASAFEMESLENILVWIE